MNSIKTNFSAQTALATLNMTNKDMEKTQGRISTGYRVGEAADNAAYWSIATTMKSDTNSLSTVKDALGLGAATVDVAYTAVDKSKGIVDQIKSKLVTARSPGVDRAKIQEDISNLQATLQSYADSASFSGENWLNVNSGATGYSATKTVVSSFNRTGTDISIGTISVDTSETKLYDTGTTATQVGILDGFRSSTTGLIDTSLTSTTGFSISSLSISSLTNSTADLATLESYIRGADKAFSEMTTAATNLGSAKSRINSQKDFVSSLMDAIDRGISSLIDADMNEESTRLQALQVQQQLGIQALSIANQSSQNILSLFRG